MSQYLKDVVAEFKGLSADEIAELARERGIKGRTGTVWGCPLSLLFHSRHTGRYAIGKLYVARECGTKVEHIHTPKNLKEFIARFDAGKYPELIAAAPRCNPATRRDSRVGQGGKPKPSTRKRHFKNHLAQLVGRFSD